MTCNKSFMLNGNRKEQQNSTLRTTLVFGIRLLAYADGSLMGILFDDTSSSGRGNNKKKCNQI